MSLLLTLACSMGLMHSAAEEVFSVQWEAASPAKPWLRQVRVVPSAELNATVEELRPVGSMQGGVRIRVPRPAAAKGQAKPSPAEPGAEG